MPKPAHLAPKKQTPLAIAEAEIVTLSKRAAALEARRDHAADAPAKASAARRKLLVDHDEPDPAALADADRAVREGTDAEAASREALREIEDRLGQLCRDVATVREAEATAAAAVKLEATASAVDAATDRMRHAAGLLDAARADLVEILSEAGNCAVAAYAPLQRGPGDLGLVIGFTPKSTALISDLTGTEVGARVAASIVATALPGLRITTEDEASMWRANGMPTPVLAPADDQAAVAALLADGLRASAASLRETVEALA